MSLEDYQNLKSSISHGFDEKLGKIIIFNGCILDGWNRYKACLETNVQPVFEYFEGDEKQAFEYSLKANQDRRHLTKSQLAAIAIEAEPLWKAIQENVEKGRREKISKVRQGIETTTLMSPSQKNENEARTKLGKTFGVASTYIAEAKKLKQTAPEKFEAVKNGEKTITQVNKEIKIEKRKADIEKQKADIEAENLPEINDKFDIITVDPPWPYGREFDPDSSRVANPYPEMSIEEIKNIKLPTKENSIIFLWTTHQFLPYAFDILKEWGADYKATMVWNKEKIGMGYWLRMQCEFCLLAVKGNPIWDINDWRDIISETRREHSRKPESFYQNIDKYFPYASKIEYFSRAQREGWAVFGNDIKKF